MPHHSSKPQRQTENLRKGRLSQKGCSYFITFCTQGRVFVSSTKTTFEASKDVAKLMQNNGDWNCHFLTVMPDHIHLLITLSSELSLQQTIGKYKSLLKRRDLKHRICWQDNFYDHRIRDPEDYESISFYMFMNPYKKKLINTNEVWKGHFIPDPTRFQFLSKCRKDELPQEEWLELELSNPVKQRSGRR